MKQDFRHKHINKSHPDGVAFILFIYFFDLDKVGIAGFSCYVAARNNDLITLFKREDVSGGIFGYVE